MTKLVLLFSLSSLLTFYIVFSHPSCTIVCLLMCVLFCFLELYMCWFGCVIFCNRFVDHFIVLFWQMSHFYILCFGRFLPMLFHRLLWVFADLFVFYCSRCLCLLFFWLLLPFVGCLCSFDVFVANSIASFFWRVLSSVGIFVALFYCFVYSSRFFLAFAWLQYIVWIDRHSYFPFVPPAHRPCTQQLSVWTLRVFCPTHTLQNMSFAYILDSFCLVFPSTPWIRTQLHPSVSIITHSHSFLTILHKILITSFPGKFLRP